VAPKTIGGISGVLGDLISPAPTAAASSELEEPQPSGRKAGLLDKPNPPTVPPQRCARLGRPPDSRLRTTVPKQKVTLRVPSDLIDQHRDWSWEARCQLSELVGQALSTYHKSHHRRQKLQ
jgi:hypothetical protein